ncbi:GDSL-type esterase/lipase family protein [Nonomuraea sp. NPDC049607]|uniref:GDSL-type esterase/lipase family protein n=1 Tax=Nonomuraea sp. NPDC049607 TaxID=3154732 RepID=UPI0034164320
MSNPLLSGISGRPVVRRLAVPALTVVLALAVGITPAGAHRADGWRRGAPPSSPPPPAPPGTAPTGPRTASPAGVPRPGVRTVIIMDGINDLAEWNKPHQATARRIIDGHKELIRAAHARGIRAVGATLTPVKGSPLAYSPAAEAVRDQVNEWIRASGAYDHVVDFEAAVRRPDDPDSLRPEYDSGDGVHLDDRGYDALARAVDLDAL